MDFELSEEQKSLMALVRDYCRKEDVAPYLEAAEKMPSVKTVEELRSNFPWEMLDNLDNVGLRQLAVPERFGGAGICMGGHLTRVLLVEEASYHNPVIGTLLALTLRYCADVEAQATPEQQDRFFTDYMKKKRSTLAIAQSEPEGMTDIVLAYDQPAGTTLRLTGKREGNDWILNGSKMFCTSGGIADKILVSVRTDEEAHVSKAMSWIWVDPHETPALSMNLNHSEIWLHPTGDVQLHFDNARVPYENLVGVENESHDIRSARIATKIIHWIQLVAFSQNILEQVVTFAKGRIQGGKPIIQHSSVACMIGEAAALIESTRALIYRAACEYDECERTGNPIIPAGRGFLCGYLAKRMAMRITEICSDIWGGIGWEKGMSLPLYARIALTFQHPGMSQSINLIKATRALMMGMV